MGSKKRPGEISTTSHVSQPSCGERPGPRVVARRVHRTCGVREILGGGLASLTHCQKLPRIARHTHGVLVLETPGERKPQPRQQARTAYVTRGKKVKCHAQCRRRV